MPATTWPLPTLQHLHRLTDDCGVIQHAKFWFPDYSTGYCVDDNSRALIVAHQAWRLFGDPVAHELMVRYLAFIFYAQRVDGKMRNFIDYSRNFLEDEGSPDSHAARCGAWDTWRRWTRCIWPSPRARCSTACTRT